jgi:hypothetical protein
MAAARDGSDGSDGKYRMIIANHYSQMATAREAFLSVARLQLAHALLAVVLVAAQEGTAWAAGAQGAGAMGIATSLILPLVHVGLAFYGRRAMKDNAIASIHSYIALVLSLAVALFLSAVYLVVFPSPLSQGRSLALAVLHSYAPLALLVLGGGAALASALHSRRFVVALASTSRKKR